MKRVGLLVTCLLDLTLPAIGVSVIKLLKRAGCRVHVPVVRSICGQPGEDSGDSAAARALALRLLEAFAAFEYVVVRSGSCAGTIKGDYLALFTDKPEQRSRFDTLAARTHELTDSLVNVARVELLDSSFSGTITYHDSCAEQQDLYRHLSRATVALSATSAHAQGSSAT